MRNYFLVSETLPLAPSSVIDGNKELINHSAKSWSGTNFLIIWWRWCHSCIWSDIWVGVVYLNLVKSFVPVSYMMGNWKWVKKVVVKAVKLSNEAHGNSMYHFTTRPVSICWKRCNLTKSSFKEFDEHHKWYVMTCIDRSSLEFPLN